MKKPNQASDFQVVSHAYELLRQRDDRGFEQLWWQHHVLLMQRGYGPEIKKVRARLAAPRNAEGARLLSKVHALASRMLAAANMGNKGGMDAARRELEGFKPQWAVVLYCNTKQTVPTKLYEKAVFSLSCARRIKPYKTGRHSSAA